MPETLVEDDPRHRRAFYALLVLAAVVYIGRLWEGGIAEDPAQYAAVAKHIYQSGDWLAMSDGFAPYYNKPPLYFWCTAALFHLTGVGDDFPTHFAARFWSAAAGVGCILLLYRIVAAWRGRSEALLAALALLLSYEFMRNAVAGRLDTPLTFFLLVSMLGYVEAYANARRRMLLLIGLGAGLAVLVKGPVGLLGPAVIVLADLLSFIATRKQADEVRVRPALSSVWFPLGLILGAFVAASWHVAMALADPAFWAHYFGHEMVQRATGGGQWTEASSKLGMLWSFFTNSLPWSALAVIGFLLMKKKLPKRQLPYAALMLGWTFFFTLAAIAVTKLYGRYFIPAFPSLCAIAAFGLFHLLKPAWREGLERFLPALAAAGIVVMALLPIPRHKDYNRPLRDMAPFIRDRLSEEEALLCYHVDKSVVHQLRGTVYFYCDREAILENRVAVYAETNPRLILAYDRLFREHLAPLGYRPLIEADELVLAERGNPADDSDDISGPGRR